MLMSKLNDQNITGWRMVNLLDYAVSRNQAGGVIESLAHKNGSHQRRKTHFSPTPPHLVLENKFNEKKMDITANMTDLMRITFGPPAFLNVDRAHSLACLSILPSYLRLRMPWRAKSFSTKSNIEVPTDLCELWLTGRVPMELTL